MFMTRDYIVFAVLVVLISFFLNLLVMAISKRKNRNERTLKNINMQIKAFRNESSSTIERISTAGRECQQAVDAKIGEAEVMVRQVADSLDSLSQHHKDLAALETVCVNYKNALEKLRISTEQAEARIQAVQDEVRKAETVNEFVISFKGEAERLTGEMQDLKSEYVRLVTSTQESLKSAAEMQRNENQDMLQEFGATLGRFRSDFGEYVSTLRDEFGAFASEEMKKAEDATIDTENRRDDILRTLEDGRKDLENKAGLLEEELRRIEERESVLRTSADTALSEFAAAVESRSSEALKSIDTAIASLQERLAGFDEAEDAELERRRTLLSDGADELSERMNAMMQEKKESFESLSETLSASFSSAVDEKKAAVDGALAELSRIVEEKEDELRSIVDELRRTGLDAEENTRKTVQEALENAENARSAMDADRNAFISASRDALQKGFDALIGDVEERYARIREDGDSFVRTLAERVQDTRETIAMLSEGEQGKIADAVDRLRELEGKIKVSEDQLSAIAEQVTHTREELFTAQQERGKLDGDIAERTKELDRLQSEMQEAKAQRINEEAALVRLKLQISALQKENAGGDAEKKKPEEMIEEFPEDIFTGSVEDVDLSDDE